MSTRNLVEIWVIINSLSERLLVVLLCLSVNLELLLICVRDNRGYNAFCRATRRAAGSNVVGPILTRFSTLHIRKTPDPEIIEESDEAVPRYFVHLGDFTRLHVWRIRGSHEFRKDITWVGRLRELQLVGGVAAKELFQVCQNAVQLENLSLIFTRGSTFPRGNPPDGQDLNSALVARATTLRVLEFRICGNFSYQRQFGDSRSLNCLPQLVELEQLTTDMLLIFGRNPGSVTLSNFPPRLKSLNLVEAWSPNPGPHIMPRSAEIERDAVEALLNLFTSFNPNRLLFSHETDPLPLTYLQD
ncbi:hypothetical protein F4776DRAFT_658530 [Hypoxylon sp. NC0597]|nr:hypothetical protein F4776DRAFT_658530 [Hypoxylon sp. NC0597]